VVVAPAIRAALVELAHAVRGDSRVLSGASTRSLVLLLPALGARALMDGRDFVGPEDLAALAPYVFAHRIELGAGADDAEAVVKEHVERVVEDLAKESLRR
jgi:MoxR-like ATPase